MSYSKNFIELLKDRNEIEELVNRYVPLKRAGSNMNGLCPFHSEKTPSFTVFPATQSYYCFGCGAGGDAISFVMHVENLDYREAVEFLARRAGIEVENDDDFGHGAGAVSVRKERVVEATREAAKFYYAELGTERGAGARAYLEKRQIVSATIKRFGIGYSPDAWDSLYNHLNRKGFTIEEMKAAFLVGISKKGNPYDIFRNRLMFPVFDLSGNPVAFSARRLNEEDDRKYVNTSDTPAFKKSKILFALNFAKNSTEGSLILCEGAVDAVMLHQAGFSNACATLGTAITDEHARIISRIAKTAYLAYDIDKAGRAATDKAINKLNEVGVSTKIISLGTEAKDPDEYIKKFGADAFRRRLNASEGNTEYTLSRIMNKYSLDISDERSMAAREVCSYIATLPTKTDIDIYASLAAEKLGVTKKMLTEDVMRIRSSYAKKDKAKLNESTAQEISGFNDRVNRDKVRFSSAASIEEKILGILLSRPDLGAEACKRLTPDSFVTDFGKKVFTLYEERFRAGEHADLSCNASLTPAEMSSVARMIAMREQVDDNSAGVLSELITKLDRQREMRDADKKIEDNPAEGLAEYIERLRKRKSESAKPKDSTDK